MQTRIALKAYLAGPAGSDPRVDDPTFLTLCLALDDEKIPAFALARVEKLRGKPVTFDLKAAPDKRQNAVWNLLVDFWSSGN